MAFNPKRRHLPLVGSPDKNVPATKDATTPLSPFSPSSLSQNKAYFSLFLSSDQRPIVDAELFGPTIPALQNLVDGSKVLKQAFKKPKIETLKIQLDQLSNGAQHERSISAVDQLNSATVLQADLAGKTVWKSIELKPALEPKVLLPFESKPGQTPRKVETERRKRVFAAQKIEDLLQKAGIYPLNNSNKENSFSVVKLSNFVPLSYFDDAEFESRLPHEWLHVDPSLINSSTLDVVFAGVPAPARAFDGKSWKNCVVMAFSNFTRRWKIRWIDIDGWDLIWKEEETILDLVPTRDGPNMPGRVVALDDVNEAWVDRYGSSCPII